MIQFSITIADGQFALHDHGNREITRVTQSFNDLIALIKRTEEDHTAEVSLSGAVFRFVLVHAMPREYAGGDAAAMYMTAVHASWPVRRFPASAIDAVQALIATGDMDAVVNYIKLTREAARNR